MGRLEQKLKTKTPITSILLVEGKDDLDFFNDLLKFLGMNDVKCTKVDGNRCFKDKLDTVLKDPGFGDVNKIAFIRDADDSADKTLESLKTCVLNVVEKRNLDKEIKDISFDSNIENIDDKRYGFYIMPDNKNPGALEDLYIKYIETDPIYHCIERYIRCIQSKGISLKNEKKATKFLYTSTKRENDCPSIGNTGQPKKGEEKVLDFNNECFASIKNFLTKMFYAK
jgi:hypothetical protein